MLLEKRDVHYDCIRQQALSYILETVINPKAHGELVISLHRGPARHFEVELRLEDPDNDAEVTLRGIAAIDPESLWPLENKPADYGQKLARQLFGDQGGKILDFFGNTKAAFAKRGLLLRVRLCIAAEELSGLRWEMLADPHTGLAIATCERTPFSRVLLSDDSRRIRARVRSDVRAVIAVSQANQVGEQRLANVDVAAEVKRAQNAMATMRPVVLGDDEPLTLDGLIHAVRQDVDILYLVCHGIAPRNDEPFLLFQQAGAPGKTALVRAGELADRFRQIAELPRLVVLASCDSAGAGDGVHAPLAMRLAEAGVPAIIAMQGRIKMATVEQMMPVFFEELLRSDGQVDHALAVARASVQVRPDAWLPVLYLRMQSGRIWETPDGVARRTPEQPKERAAVYVSTAVDSQRLAVLDVMQRFQRRGFLLDPISTPEALDACRLYVGILSSGGAEIVEQEYRRARGRGLDCHLYCSIHTTTDPVSAAVLREWKNDQAVMEFSSDRELAARFATDIENWHFEQILAPRFQRTALDGIDLLPTDYSGRIGNFLVEYLGTAKRPVPFGGRREEMAMLDRWLDSGNRRPYALLAAPAGRGKSALVTRWCTRLLARPEVSIIFVPVSIRFRTNLSSVVFASLAARVARVFGDQIQSPGEMTADLWRGLLASYLRRNLADGRRLLVVIDGLDEASDWSAEADLFPRNPPDGLKVLVTARYRVGDVDGSGWLQTLGWDVGLGEAIALDPLTREGVAEVMLGMGAPLDQLGTRVDVVGELHRLSEGDPLLVRLYVEDLWSRGAAASKLQPEDLVQIRPGLSGYFQKWWKDQQQLWGNTAPLREKAVQCLLNLLACALGPLRVDDLQELAPEDSGLNTWSLDEALRPLNRFVIGDGREQGYVFSHPKLAFHFYGLLGSGERRAWDQRFLDWGARCLEEVKQQRRQPADVPPYLVQYYGAHLERAQASSETLLALVSNGWRQVWLALEGAFNGFLNDVERAWRSLEASDAARVEKGLEPQYVDRAIECALCLASVRSLAAQIQPELLAALVEKKVWNGAQAIAYLRQMTDARQQMLGLASVSPWLPESLLEQAVGLSGFAPVELLVRLAACGRATRALSLLEQDAIWIAESGTDEFGSWRNDAAYAKAQRAAVLGMARYLTADQAESLMEFFKGWVHPPPEIVEAVFGRLDESRRLDLAERMLLDANATAAEDTIERIASGFEPLTAWNLWERAAERSDQHERDLAFLALAPAFPEQRRAAAVDEICDRILGEAASPGQFEVLARLLPWIPEVKRNELVRRIASASPPRTIVQRLLPYLDEWSIRRLVEGPASERAIELIPLLAPVLPADVCMGIAESQSEENENFREDVLASVAPRLLAEQRRRLLEEAVEKEHTLTIRALAPALSRDDVEMVIDYEYDAVYTAQLASRLVKLGDWEEAITLVDRVCGSNDTRRRGVWYETWEAIANAVQSGEGAIAVLFGRFESGRAPASLLSALAGKLPAALLRKALQIVQHIGDTETELEARAAIVNEQDRERFESTRKRIQAGERVEAKQIAEQFVGAHKDDFLNDLAASLIQKGDLETAFSLMPSITKSVVLLSRRDLTDHKGEIFDRLLTLWRRRGRGLTAFWSEWPESRAEVLVEFFADAVASFGVYAIPEAVLRRAGPRLLEEIGALESADRRLALLVLAEKLEGHYRVRAIEQLVAQGALEQSEAVRLFDAAHDEEQEQVRQLLEAYLPESAEARLDKIRAGPPELWHREWESAAKGSPYKEWGRELPLQWEADLTHCAPLYFRENASAYTFEKAQQLSHVWLTETLCRIAERLSEPYRTAAWDLAVSSATHDEFGGVLQALPGDVVQKLRKETLLEVVQHLDEFPVLWNWLRREKKSLLQRVLETAGLRSEEAGKNPEAHERAKINVWAFTLELREGKESKEDRDRAFEMACHLEVPEAMAHAFDAMLDWPEVRASATQRILQLVLANRLSRETQVRLLHRTRDPENAGWKAAAALVVRQFRPFHSAVDVGRVAALIEALPGPERLAVMGEVLHALSRCPRAELLAKFGYLAELVRGFGGSASLARTDEAIQRVIAWWP